MEYIGIHQTENLEDGYLGSGLIILRAIKKYGADNFKREIIKFCDSYQALIEQEVEFVNEDWVNRKDTYNLKTGGQSIGVLSKESRDKISKTLKEKYASGEIISPTIGREFVVGPEYREKISKTLKERYKEHPHPTLGVEPWNKGKKGVQIGWLNGKKGMGLVSNPNKGKKLEPLSKEQKEKISDSLKEYYKNNESATKGLEPWNKGKVMERTECPHCGKMVDVGNGKRWHFDNCKLKK